MTGRARLDEAFGGENLAWLLERLKGRLEQGRDLSGSVTLQKPSPEQRRALDALLGRRPSRGSSLAVPLVQLERIVRSAGLADSLEGAVREICGPIENQVARRRDQELAWAQLFEQANERLSKSGELQELHPWLDELRDFGALKRLCRGDLAEAHRLLEQALTALDRLPARGVPLPQFAAELTGDSHGLDPDRPLARLLVRAGAKRNGDLNPSDAAEFRDAWAALGVLCDELAAPVLTYRLSAVGDTFSGRMLQQHARQGEPYRLSLRQLLHDNPKFVADPPRQSIFVCENPAIVAAATRRLQAGSAPLLCVEGQPSTASIEPTFSIRTDRWP